MTAVRVALVEPPDAVGGHEIGELASGLRELGHDVSVLTPGPSSGLAEAVLRSRGFTGPLTHVPGLGLRLLRGRFHIVHCFSLAEAAVAVKLRRRGRVVLTVTERLDRSSVANARLRLLALTLATEGADALLAASEREGAAVRRWLARDVPVLEPRDHDGHDRLYRRVLGVPARAPGP